MELVIKDLQKKFEKKEVLRGIDFSFEDGKIYGLLGRNGAGGPGQTDEGLFPRNEK